MMPLKVVYVDEKRSTKQDNAVFSFGSGTLHGHLLVSYIDLMGAF